MPTYLHKCDDCQHEFELDYSIKADPPTTCPECKHETVRRMISGDLLTKMELTSKEFMERLPGDTRNIMKDLGKSENKFANVVGESTYNTYSKKPGNY